MILSIVPKHVFFEYINLGILKIGDSQYLTIFGFGGKHF